MLFEPAIQLAHQSKVFLISRPGRPQMKRVLVASLAVTLSGALPAIASDAR
jgi:hypothetical protein